MLIFTLGGVGYGLYRILTNQSQKKQIEQKYEASIKLTSNTMAKIFAELKQYHRELDKYDAYYEQIKDAFAKI